VDIIRYSDSFSASGVDRRTETIPRVSVGSVPEIEIRASEHYILSRSLHHDNIDNLSTRKPGISFTSTFLCFIDLSFFFIVIH
jgi:hypothetical protein